MRAIAILASLCLLAAGGCERDSARAQAGAVTPAIAVRVVEIDRAPLRPLTIVPGLVEPRETFELGFPAGGVLSAALVDAGDEVVAGQALAALDATAARASLSQARAGARHARRDLSRARTLARGGSIASSGLDDATTAARLARGDLALAGYAMRYSTLRAPDDGWVIARLADPGEVVGPGQIVLHLASRSRGWVLRIAVPDRLVARLAPGDAAEVRLDAAPELPIAARIVDVARAPSPGSGTFDVELEIEPPRGIELRTGLVGRAAIATGDPVACSVPLSALVDGHDLDAAVFVVAGDQARRLPVRVAFLAGDRAAIAAGLERDVSSVVAAGAERLSDGSRVTIAGREDK
jgi:multidrug efflux system membrane fusion protein